MAFKRAATYIRMSTDKQEDSPERQKSLIAPYNKLRGYHVVQEYVDLEEKGWDDSRAGLQALIRDAQAGKFDVVVVDEWSRLSRSDFIKTITGIIAPLRDAGVQLDTVRDGPKNWNDIAGQIMLVVDAHKSESETKETARRTLSQLIQFARSGTLFLGKVPYGYVAVEEEVRKGEKRRTKLLPGDPRQVEVVRRIFDWYVHFGWGAGTIARELTSKGHPAPYSQKGWFPTTVSSILQNPNYAGHYRFNHKSRRRFAHFVNGAVSLTNSAPQRSYSKPVTNRVSDWVVVQNTHEPLVTQEIWDSAQTVRVQRSETISARRTASRTTARFLSGVIHCYHCHRPMYHAKILGRDKWRCATNMRRLPGWDDCKCYCVADSVVAPVVMDELESLITSAGTLKKFTAHANAEAKKKSDSSTRESLTKKLDKTKKKIDTALENAMEAPRHLAQQMYAKIADLEKECEQIQSELAQAGRDPNAEAELAVSFVTSQFARMRSFMNEGQVALANSVLMTFVKRIEVEFQTSASKTGKKEWHTPVRLHFTLHAALAGRGSGPIGCAFPERIGTYTLVVYTHVVELKRLGK